MNINCEVHHQMVIIVIMNPLSEIITNKPIKCPNIQLLKIFLINYRKVLKIDPNHLSITQIVSLKGNKCLLN